jgi:hypothetical protein
MQALVGDWIVYVENSDRNANVKTGQAETLSLRKQYDCFFSTIAAPNKMDLILFFSSFSGGVQPCFPQPKV